jgi:hypothetical protein
MLHPFGKLALSRDDRWTARWVGGALAVALGTIGYCIAWDDERAFPIAFHVASAALTVMCTFTTQSPWPRRAMLIYMIVILVLAGTSVTMLLCEQAFHNAPEDVVTVASGVILFVDRIMKWNPLISTLAPGILMQYQPRRH